MKTYLVDTENVLNTWVTVLDELGPRDRVILFVTENSPKMTMAEMKSLERYMDRIQVMECFGGTPNALDFQLCAQLGTMTRNATKSEYIIVSQDNGYDPVIAMMLNKGRNVSRLDTKTGHVQKKTKIDPIMKVRNVLVEKEKKDLDIQRVADLIGKDKDSEDTLHVVEAIKSCKTLSKLHENLQQWKGSTGIQYYREVRNYFANVKSGIGA